MTEQEYNNAEGIRRSDLWLMSRSAQIFRHHMDNPEDECEKSPALIFGSACHKWILEPKEFTDEYVLAPNIDRRTKAGKEEWAAFEVENAGKTIISEKDFDLMNDMSNALMSHALANRMVHEGQHEVPYFWTDPETGEKCKCKADIVGRDADGRYVVVDYKTARDAQTEPFVRIMVRLGYHVQAAMYTEGLSHALNLDYRPEFYFVVQEKDAPYAVNVVHVDETVMRFGDSEYHKLLQQYHDCNEMGDWPGYCRDEPNETHLPGYVELGEDEE